MSDGGFQYSRTGFGVQSFNWHIELIEQFKKVMEEWILQRGAKNGITKHAGCERSEVLEVFLSGTLWSLGKIEPLKFLRENRNVTFARGITQNFFQQLSWTNVRWLSFIIDQFS